MRLRHSVVGIVTLVALLLTPLAPLSSSGQVALAQTGDPSGRVGRLSYTTGQVSYAPAGVNQWAPAVLNYPLTTGAALWADAQARAELHIGSTAIRMDQYTELDILNLDDQTAQLRVPQGTMEVSLYQLAAGERFEVATPTASVTLVQPGRYRFQVDNSGLRLTVWSGQAEVATSSYTFAISAAQTVLIGDSTAGGPAYQVIQTPTLDEFGQWCLARHQEEQRALQVASQYGSPMVTGIGDLAAYGTWRTVGGYGWGWFPKVQADWAPYRFGRWVWISPWGWTWIDNSPWGFAPFHYGRWILIGSQWCWIPGPIYARPVFAPALVVFFIIGGIVGWFPLAPQDVYMPPYYVSPQYFQTVNVIVININIYNVRTVDTTDIHYVYRDHHKAMTLVRQDQFAGASMVSSGLMSAPDGELSRARVLAAAPVQPNIRSVLGHPQPVDAARPPKTVEQRPVVVRQTPPVVTPPTIPGVQAVPRVAPVKQAADRPSVVSPPAPQPPQVRPAPQPQPAQPVAPQPGVATPRPVPQPPQVGPASQGPQTRPNPAPGGLVKPVSCDPQSPAYDPRQCPPAAPQPRPAQRQAPQPRPMQPAPQPQPAQPVAPQPGVATPRPVPQPPQVGPASQGPQTRPNPAPRGPVKRVSCDPRSPDYDPRQCPPPTPGR